MGMSTYVVGFKPADDKHNKMRAAWEACEAAKIPIPAEVLSYFGGERPDEGGVKVDLYKHPAVKPWRATGREGYEVDLRELDPDVKILRFVNSY